MLGESRTRHACPPGPALSFNERLRTEALRQAQDAERIKWWPADGGPTIHNNPERGDVQTRIKATGYCSVDANSPTNENGYNGFYLGSGINNFTPQSALNYWKNSPGHWRTLTSRDYNESGVAVIRGIPTMKPPSFEDANGKPLLDSNGKPVPPDGGFIVVETFGGCSKPETIARKPITAAPGQDVSAVRVAATPTILICS